MLPKLIATASVVMLIVPLAANAEKPTTVEVVNADPIPVSVSSLPPGASEILSNRFQGSITIESWTPYVNGDSFATFQGWKVPDDKILVVEYISAEARANPGDLVDLHADCQGVPGLDSARIEMPLTSIGNFGTYEEAVGGAPVKCYTGNALLVSAHRTSDVPVGSHADVTFSVVG